MVFISREKNIVYSLTKLTQNMYIFLWVIFIPSMQMYRVRYHVDNQFSITIHLFDLVNLMNVSYEKNSNTLIVTILVINRA